MASTDATQDGTKALRPSSGPERLHASTLRVAHVASADTLEILLNHISANHHWLRFDETVAADDQQIRSLLEDRLDVGVCNVRGVLPDALDATVVRLDPIVSTALPGRRDQGVDPRQVRLDVGRYGSAWPLYDNLVEQYEHAIGCRFRRLSVPVQGGHDHGALLRGARGRRTAIARSGLGATRREAESAGLTPLQPYVAWQLVWRRTDNSSSLREFRHAATTFAQHRGWRAPSPDLAPPWLPSDDLYQRQRDVLV